MVGIMGIIIMGYKTRMARQVDKLTTLRTSGLKSRRKEVWVCPQVLTRLWTGMVCTMYLRI
jgi:hypothetical protein